ncbi:ankyrin repeat domain-containing protein 26-like [Scleropages formosus]|uniref:ankyrin repeat domain-containing protein 26-like n=1 Tax=Scleropages formosus TaxID=113540 RepID=UPI0010FABA85|nr:ankyrin repeat domain-containing protein 26-like [Scleropages formosus]
MEAADDFDDIILSSDSTADEVDSAGSQESVLIGQLTSCKGFISMVKHQNALQEYEWAIQRETTHSPNLSHKLSQLKVENEKLRQIFKDTCDIRSALELQKLELETDLKNLMFTLKHEQEKHCDTTMLYNKTCEQLKAMETQYHAEMEERQKVELMMKNLELEMKMLDGSMKQAMSQVTQANDREKDLLHENRKLQEQVISLKLELDLSRTRSQQDENWFSTLREKLDDTRKELKLKEELLGETIIQYNEQLSALRAECTLGIAKLEHEKQAREELELEAETARARLAATLQELERSHVAHADLQRALQRERDDDQRAREKLEMEEASQRESIHSLSQQLGAAKAWVSSLEQELHHTKLSLSEKSLMLETVQKEHSQTQARLAQLESILKARREQAERATARQKVTEEHLAQAHQEVALLRQQLQESQSTQGHCSELLAKLRADCEKRVTVAEDKTKELLVKSAELQEKLKRREKEKEEEETAVRQLKQELADMLKKLSACEALLEVNQQHQADFEEEKKRLLWDVERLKGKLQDSEEQYVEAERLIRDLRDALDSKECNVITTSQKLQEVLSASAGTDKTVKQLEEAVQQLESENTRLETLTKQQTHSIEALQKGALEAAAVKNHLEDLVTNLQGSKMNLEDQLNQELLKKNMLSQNVEDSHQLWEEELKIRSKLSLSLVTLEKENKELSTQLEVEKKKVKKISDQKRSVYIRLEQEMKRNTDLQKETCRMKTLVKLAKKKLMEQGKAESGLQSDSLQEKMKHRQAEADVDRIKSKLQELSSHLDNEAATCKRLVTVNQDLKEKLLSFKDLAKSHEQLKRSKRQLEEEVAGLRRQIQSGVMDRSQAELYRREIEERVLREVRQKLEEVSLCLQNQAASHDAQEQMKASNEASVWTQMEQRLQEMENELGRLRSNHLDSLSQRDSMQAELDHFRKLYSKEHKLRKSLTAKMERSYDHLARIHNRLPAECQRKSLISSRVARGSLNGPHVPLQPLSFVTACGATLGFPNNNLALANRFVSPTGDIQNCKVETYIVKMQNDLDKKVSKKLDHVLLDKDESPCISPLGLVTSSQKSLTGEQEAIDYRRIVGDMEPIKSRCTPSEGEHLLHGLPIHGYLHGHKTAAQRYSATRRQAGYEPER